MSELDVEELNPGIRRTVTFLNMKGFETCDSGDGKTHDYECDRSYPYVIMQVEPAEKLIEECRRLRTVLAEIGLDVPEQSPEVGSPAIQGTYDPANDIAFIDLMGVNDAMLFDGKKPEEERKPS